MAINVKENMKRSGRKPVDGRYVGVAIAVAVAFFVSYGYASAAKTSPTAAYAGNSVNGTFATNTGSAGGGGGCCGGGGGGGGCGAGGAQKTTKGATTVAAGVQKVTIDLTGGQYAPNEISAKAGVPLELDFKGPAKGCNGAVQSQDLGFQQDVTNGGTINVGPLKPGTYTFACSMNMYTATIVVK